MVFGHGCTHGGDGAFETGLVGGDDIHIAFGDDDGVAFAGGVAGMLFAVKHAAFVEERCVGGVDVFGGFVIAVGVGRADMVGEDAPAECDDAASSVGDGEYDAVAEEDVGIAAAGGFF